MQFVHFIVLPQAQYPEKHYPLTWLKNYHIILSLYFLLAQLAVHKEFHGK